MTAALVLCAALGALALGQVAMTAIFLRAAARREQPTVADDQFPPAAIVLCVRGADPFLSRTLRAIFAQNYPNYTVRIVVDHPDDPAARLVDEALARFPSAPACVQFLQPTDRGGLKCQSLVQAIEQLDEHVEVLALVDADALPHSNWLRELVTPLVADSTAAVVTGNRWYVPIDAGLANIARYAWNAYAVVQMYLYRIPWGGSMAVRMSFVRQAGLANRWSGALCEDTMLHQVARDLGLEARPAPTLLLFNREGVTLAGLYRWLERQLLFTRLYHPAWPAVALHAALVSLTPLAALGLAACAAVGGQPRIALCCLAGFGGYVLVLALLLPPLQWRAAHVARQRGDSAAWLSLEAFVRFLAAAPLTAVLHLAAVVRASFTRRVEWRGVEYDARDPWNVRLSEYRPWQSSGEQAGTSL